MFYWIYEVPTPQLALLIAGSFVVFFWVGCFIARPPLRTFVRARSGTNDIVGNILSCFCVFYGLLLGLIAVAVYQNLNRAEENVAREAVAMTTLYQDFTPYPEPLRQSMRQQLRDYCSYVLHTAWPQYRRGVRPPEGRQRMLALRTTLLSFEPKDFQQMAFHSETLRQFDTFYEARRTRLQDVTQGIPAVMWYVVMVGAFITMALVWMFEMRLLSQLFLGGLLAFYMGTMIFLIASMDTPYRGEPSVRPEPFEEAYQVLLAADAPPPPP